MSELEKFASDLLCATGMDEEKAATTARLLVLTDAMGRKTHGLAMLPLYLADIERGHMQITGEPEIVKDSPITAVWDGRYLPGLWLVDKAIGCLMSKASEHGMSALAIKRSHHIGCLATLIKGAADKGFVALIANSDPVGKRVAPYGGKEALFTPNPFAFGYPEQQNAVLVDMCASITTTSMTREHVKEGRDFEHAWLLDSEGKPTTDARVLEHREPRGSLQLVGGAQYGHKGFGLSLMVETLSQGLAGHGRADVGIDNRMGWGGNVFVQVIDPAFFAGDDAYARQADHLAAACRENPPIDPLNPVRMPGDQAHSRLQQALQEGVGYEASVVSALNGWAKKLGTKCLD